MVCAKHGRLLSFPSDKNCCGMAKSNSGNFSLFRPVHTFDADFVSTYFIERAKVYCNGEVVMTIGSTKPELHVDVWSGNHPFYTGTQKIIDTEGRVERFLRKYGMSSADAEDEG